MSAKPLPKAIARRRTFAIISHPDAGKTTLTEKLLLFGGAIQLAGAVKARGERRRARSDWMKVEKERGISVTSSVMTFDYGECTFNLLDTPGHEDFSEDTYRTLTAVDSAVMVLDAAKGIEAQTRKLFEVCRLRDVPIVTFINKLDREGRDTFDLLDEIEQELALEVSPRTWPIGRGSSFRGYFDLASEEVVLMQRGKGETRAAGERFAGLDADAVQAALPGETAAALRDEVEMAQGLCVPFRLESYREGNLTPVFFGSALNNFGVQALLDALAAFAPPPQPRRAAERTVSPEEPELTGFVFKIQANMDPNHRDRLAFVRLCSGKFERGMKIFHPRSERTLNVRNAVLFMAQDRELAEEAWAGDIIGIPNHGNLHIGDALSEGEVLHFRGIPSFAPELLRSIRPLDPMRAKHLGKALRQLAEEGAAQAFRAEQGGRWVVGVAGALQFEVLADRIRTEYDLEVEYDTIGLHLARWVRSTDSLQLERFSNRNQSHLALDHQGRPVYLARSDWQLKCTQEDWPQIEFLKSREPQVETVAG